MDLRNLTYTYFLRRRQSKSLPADMLKGSVIELGAGLDNFSVLFSHDRYTAVDLDTSLAGKGFRFICQDIRRLDFDDNSFDYFIASNVLEHIEAPSEILKRLHAICRNGGYVVVPVNGDFPFFYDPINWIRKRLGLTICNYGIGGFGHVSLLSEQAWLKIFEECGYNVINKRRYTMDLWSCLEFMFFSIFFSRTEYVALCKSKVTKGNDGSSTVSNIIYGLLTPIYSSLKYLSFKMPGHVGVEFYLSRRH